MKQYRTTQPCYLNMKGGGANPLLIDEGVTVGEGTPYDFEGPPSIGMVPITEEAEAAHSEMLEGNTPGAQTVKDTPQPAEGGATPFDPASSKKDSDIESGKADADSKKSSDAAASKKS